ncbi:MAG TPA: MCP four helix bundle domain-containing protein [Candidatus Saccharimonadales bacterium]|nr:MCP four helix bundle domain-containing protein [Candidatus Saccharimonadales bacterium]
MRIHWTSILISLLIVTSGMLGSRTLIRVDQDLRVIYAEYTLAATDLGHVNGELIRYRTTVLRAIEAGTKEEFHRIEASLQHKQERLNRAMKRFVDATNEASSGKRMDARELAEVKAVRERMDAYIASSHQAIERMEQRWSVASLAEAQRLQAAAKQYWANDSTIKFNSVTVELDRLLEVVAEIAGEVKKEADASLRIATVAVIAVSLALALVTLVVPLKSLRIRERV